jgi:hypothetical protein
MYISLRQSTLCHPAWHQACCACCNQPVTYIADLSQPATQPATFPTAVSTPVAAAQPATQSAPLAAAVPSPQVGKMLHIRQCADAAADSACLAMRHTSIHLCEPGQC